MSNQLKKTVFTNDFFLFFLGNYNKWYFVLLEKWLDETQSWARKPNNFLSLRVVALTSPLDKA